jgi:hypothetical protein
MPPIPGSPIVMSEHRETVDQPEPEDALEEDRDPEQADSEERPVDLDDPGRPDPPIDEEDRDPARRDPGDG